jgi:hypothetical protein
MRIRRSPASLATPKEERISKIALPKVEEVKRKRIEIQMK